MLVTVKVVVIAEEYSVPEQINHVWWVGASQIITHPSIREILYKGIRIFKILGDTAAEQALRIYLHPRCSNISTKISEGKLSKV